MFRKGTICLSLVIFSTIGAFTKIETNKCTPSDLREIFKGCVLDYRDMTLWCDMTNLTSLPYPETIKSQAPCSKSSALYMNNSCVVNLDPEILNKYTRLEVISFSDNLIETIINGTFSNQKDLRKLDLSFNRISAIEVEAFTGAIHLTLLNLSNNRLSKINHALFNTMIRLSELNLDYNIFEAIEADWFKHSPTLQRLSLRGNNLKELPANVFETIQAIQEVDLRDNSLEMLPGLLFKELCFLRQLLISGNRLTLINPQVVINVVRNHEILHLPADPHALANNTWICDCQMTAYWTFLKEMENTSLHSNIGEAFNIVCEFPNQFAGEKLSRLSKDDLCKEDVFFAILKSENEDENTTSFSSSNSLMAKYVTDKCNETQLSDPSSSSSSPVSDITTPSKSRRSSYFTSPAYESISVISSDENYSATTIICGVIAVAICIIINIIVLSFCYKKMSLKEKGKLFEKQKLNNRTVSVTSDSHKNEKESNCSDVSSQSPEAFSDSDESTKLHDADPSPV